MNDDADIAGTQHDADCIMCDRNAEFYCNTCGDELCAKCKIKHLKSNASKNHTVVQYREKSTTFVREMCTTHPSFSYGICCSQCEVPVCIRCIKEKHQGHTFEDTDVIYESMKSRSDEEVAKIKEQILPLCRNILGDIKTDTVKCQTDISEIRETMSTRAKTIKEVVDDVLSENMEVLDGIQNSLISELKNQDKAMNSYINNLEDAISKYEQELKTSKTKFIFGYNKVENLKQMPEMSDVNIPYFFGGQIQRDFIVDMLGRIITPTSRPSCRKSSPEIKVSTLKLSPTAKQIRSFRPSGMGLIGCHQISCLKSGEAWLSDFFGNLILIDCNGKTLHSLMTSIFGYGCHTVSIDEELLFISKKWKCINRVTADMKIITFVKLGEGEPCSIYSSQLNGDILVGVSAQKNSIIRFEKEGKERGKFSCTNLGIPNCVIENRNDDVLTTDYEKLVVFNVKGNLRFTYTGHPPESQSFKPCGITTDVLGHILVRDLSDNSIHVLDQDGNFISYLSTSDGKITDVGSIGIDNEHNIWLSTTTGGHVCVYEYLQQV